VRALLDAHNHLQARSLAPHLDEILETLTEAGIEKSVVNGTSESDWPSVASLAAQHPTRVLPSFGLHPWFAAQRSDQWLETLTKLLHDHPQAGVGECGLDRWMQEHDLEDQRMVLHPQIELATTLARPLTLHCLQAWGPLLDCLQQTPLPTRGFLLHAYSGSRELVPAFTDLGAYFSFSGAFLHENKKKRRETFRSIPRERLLIETDAPAMRLPSALQSHEIPSHPELNHPANLRATFDGLCQLLSLPAEETRALLYENEACFFPLAN
jgi:TatD DNase family protein